MPASWILNRVKRSGIGTMGELCSQWFSNTAFRNRYTIESSTGQIQNHVRCYKYDRIWIFDWICQPLLQTPSNVPLMVKIRHAQTQFVRSCAPFSMDVWPNNYLASTGINIAHTIYYEWVGLYTVHVADPNSNCQHPGYHSFLCLSMVVNICGTMWFCIKDFET